MYGRQIQKVNMLLTVAQLCRENIAILAMVPAMMHNAQTLDKIVKTILDYVNQQAEPIKPITEKKQQNHKQLCKQTAQILGIICSYSKAMNDLVLFHKAKNTYSKLFRLHQGHLRSICNHYINFIEQNLHCFRDFGLTKQMLNEFKRQKQEFDTLYSMPRIAKVKRIISTEMLAEKIKEANFLVKEQMDTLIPALRQFPEFCLQYKAARRHIKYGRPKETLKNKINKYKEAPALPAIRKSKKIRTYLKPLMETVDQLNKLSSESINQKMEETNSAVYVEAKRVN
jgi:hypothetical protein